MKNVFLLFVALLLVVSCDRNTNDLISETTDAIGVTNNLTSEQAQRNFAIILSKAACRSQKLRSFLKENAQKRFDNNYDVFYPYVKNSMVEQGKTFRQLMVEYSSEERVAEIEKSLPLLTIFVPDLSMFNAFDVNGWDVSQQDILVSYDDGNSENLFFEDGEEELKLSLGEVPAFPFLLVKSTNRMKVIGKTRANGHEELAYDFADDSFKPQVLTRGDGSHSDIANDTIPADSYVKVENLHPLVLEAYNLCNGDHFSPQRDYIYYGLYKNNPKNGRLKLDVREKFVKFKISPGVLDRLSDYKSNLDRDPYLKDEVFVKKHPLTVPEIINQIWHDGRFTFNFYFYSALRDREKEPKITTLDISAHELFHIDRIHLRYKHKTGARHSKYHYTVKTDYLSAKWVDVPKAKQDIMPSSWDLSSLAKNIFVRVLEFDEGQKKTETHSVTNTFEYKGNFGAGVEFGKVKLNVGASAGKTETRTDQVVIETTNSSDELGTTTINYDHKIIVSDNKKAEGLYEIRTYSTGDVDFMIIPTVE